LVVDRATWLILHRRPPWRLKLAAAFRHRGAWLLRRSRQAAQFLCRAVRG
jgi:hypothetical protein